MLRWFWDREPLSRSISNSGTVAGKLSMFVPPRLYVAESGPVNDLMRTGINDNKVHVVNRRRFIFLGITAAAGLILPKLEIINSLDSSACIPTYDDVISYDVFLSEMIERYRPILEANFLADRQTIKLFFDGDVHRVSRGKRPF